jgi:hypothetical protein
VGRDHVHSIVLLASPRRVRRLPSTFDDSFSPSSGSVFSVVMVSIRGAPSIGAAAGS